MSREQAADDPARDRAPLLANVDQIEAAFKRAKSGTGSWFGALFTTGITLGSFFAGFTLNIVTSTANSEEQNDIEARNHAAISSLLFVLTVLVCSASSLAYAFHQADFDLKVEQTRKVPGRFLGRFTKTQALVSLLSIIMQGVVLTAVLYFFRIMKAYARVAGIVGISFTALAMAIAVVVWILQTFKKSKEPAVTTEQAE